MLIVFSREKKTVLSYFVMMICFFFWVFNRSWFEQQQKQMKLICERNSTTYCCCSQFSWSICFCSNGKKNVRREWLVCISILLLVMDIAIANFIWMFQCMRFSSVSTSIKPIEHVPTISQRYNWSNSKCSSLNKAALFCYD